MPTMTMRDGTEIYYKDWGGGQPIVFSHGWPLSSDAFEDKMLFLASHGYRCIAHDRLGHGRSSQPSDGNDMDVAADRAQYFREFSLPFYGYNRPGAPESQGVRDAFWMMSMQGGLKPERMHDAA